jgi:hypothetical protein
MSDKNEQVTAPETSAGKPADGLNSVGMAPGADRLDFLQGLVDEAPLAEEAEETPAPDSEVETNEAAGDEPVAEEGAPAEPPADEVAAESGNEDPEAEEEDLEGASEALRVKIAKRIGKEVGRRKALEERLLATEAKLTELQATGQKPAAAERQASGNPIDDAETSEQLTSAIGQVQEWRDYADLALDRIEDDPVAVAEELKRGGFSIGEDPTPQQLRMVLKDLRNKADRALRADKLQSAGESVKVRQAARKQMETDFPWSIDHRSREYVTMQNVLAQHPSIRRAPNGELMAAIFIKGLKAYEAEKAGKRPAVAPAKAKAQPKAPSAAPSRLTPARGVSAANFSEAQQAYLKTGDKSHRQRMVEMVTD